MFHALYHELEPYQKSHVTTRETSHLDNLQIYQPAPDYDIEQDDVSHASHAIHQKSESYQMSHVTNSRRVISIMYADCNIGQDEKCLKNHYCHTSRTQVTSDESHHELEASHLKNLQIYKDSTRIL